MKKLLADFAYILLAIVLVFGVIQYALPNVAVDLTSDPIVPPVPGYVKGVEALAAIFNEEISPEVTALVLNFWSSDCEYCMQQLIALDTVMYYREDILALALTVETNPDIVDAIIIELDLRYTTLLYGLPKAELPLSSFPNTHVLIRGEDGVWKVPAGGTWIGFVEAEVIIQFIVDNTAE